MVIFLLSLTGCGDKEEKSLQLNAPDGYKITITPDRCPKCGASYEIFEVSNLPDGITSSKLFLTIFCGCGSKNSVTVVIEEEAELIKL